MLQKIKRMIEGIVKLWPATAAQDKLNPPGNFYNSSSAQLLQRGKVGSSSEFKNIIGSMAFPYNDSVCGPKRADVIYCRTTPVSDADYDDLPIGSLAIFQTVSSTSVADTQIYINNIYGYGDLMANNRDNIITATATAAQATAQGRWAGLRVRSINTVDCSAVEQHGIYVETECTGTGQCSNHYGIKVETYITSGASVGDHYGIGVYTYSDVAGDNEIYCLRLEHNGAADAAAFLCLQAAAGMRYLISSSATNDEWMSVTTTVTCATAGGWYRVKHGGYTRYIQLYQSVS